MLASAEEHDIPHNHHPFWYAQVLGIFHVLASSRSSGSTPKRIDFLWIRWMGRDVSIPSGSFPACRLDRVGFVEGNGNSSFGFVDPQDVIRAAHAIPFFREGRNMMLLRGRSIVQDKDGDWSFFQINR
jgi:hypothetical protein